MIKYVAVDGCYLSHEASSADLSVWITMCDSQVIKILEGFLTLWLN